MGIWFKLYRQYSFKDNTITGNTFIAAYGQQAYRVRAMSMYRINLKTAQNNYIDYNKLMQPIQWDGGYEGVIAYVYVETFIDAQDTIAFVSGTPATITDSGNGFVAGGIVDGENIRVVGSSSNDGEYRIATVVAGTITLATGETLSNEGAAADVTIHQYQSRIW